MELANSIKECDELSIKIKDITFVFKSDKKYGDISYFHNSIEQVAIV